jgi:hypothetical protein
MKTPEIALPLLFCFFIASPAAGQAASGGPSVSAVKSGTGTTTSINVQKVTLKEGDTVSGTLVRYGIKPTSDAYGYVLDLNPDLESVNDVRVRQSLKVPTALDNTGMVTLQVNSDLRGSIRTSSNTLSREANEAALDSETRKRMNRIAMLSSSVAERPISTEELEQVEALNAKTLAIAQKRKSGEAISPKEKETVVAVEADLKAKADSPVSDVILTVKTVKEADGTEVPLLTVCYVPVALFEDACQGKFDKLSSPTMRRLPIANYMIWAIKEGHRVSQSKIVEVRKDTTFVDLPVE